jgi:hypothetical protein
MSRPKDIYLVAKYLTKPKDHVNTSVKGWMKDPANIRYDESMEVTRGLRNRDVNAQVVLNLSQKKVERNSFKTDKDFDTIFMYYFNNYSQYLIPVIGQLDPNYLTNIAEKIKQDLEQEPQDPNTIDAKYEELETK